MTNQAQRARLGDFFREQRAILLRYWEEERIAGVKEFLRETGVEAPQEA